MEQNGTTEAKTESEGTRFSAGDQRIVIDRIEINKPGKRGTRQPEGGKEKEGRKRQKKQEQREERIEQKGHEEEEQHTCGLRSTSYRNGRCRAENTQPD